MTDVSSLSLTAALLAGLMGSPHCLGMCGGLAGAVGMRARAGNVAARTFFSVCMAHGGRLASYTLFGAAAGASGQALQALLDLVRLGRWLRIAAGIVAIAMAVRMVSRWNAFSMLERVGGKLWSRWAPNARALATTNTPWQSLLFGVAWGWLPCGLVYSMALFAAASGSVAGGAFTMMAFGVGGLPATLTGSLLALQTVNALRRSGLRWATALTLAGFGVWTLLAASPHQHVH